MLKAETPIGKHARFRLSHAQDRDTLVNMSSDEILAALPGLTAQERTRIFELLCQLRERDLPPGDRPTEDEKKLFEEAIREFEQDRTPGSSWREALQQFRSSRVGKRPNSTPPPNHPH